MSDKNESAIKIGLGVWVCFCVLISLWIFTRFLRGKEQLYSNLHIVEDSLRKMQEKLEREQRKKSMGYVETLDDITACIDKEDNSAIKTQQDETEGEGQPLLMTENEICKMNTEELSEEQSEDKKNI